MITNETEHSDDRERERMVFGTEIDWSNTTGGMERIGPLSEHMDSGICVATFDALMREGYIDPSDTQNRSPPMETLAEFGSMAEREADNITVEFTGYMISPERNDSRITMTAIDVDADVGHAIPREIQNEFIDKFRNADNFEFGDKYCGAWWD